MSRTLSSFLAALLLSFASACSSTKVDLDAWRASESIARPSGERGSVASDLARVGELRDARRLDEARP